MASKVKTFVVKRSQWLRGTGEGFLRNTSGMQCCLGFVGRQCGIKAKDMRSVEMPYNLLDGLSAKYPTLSKGSWDEFAKVNDAQDVTDRVREKDLKALAKKRGFRFKFVD